MGNIHNFSVIRQCFSYIEDDFSTILADYRVQKFNSIHFLKLLLAAQIGKLDSLRTISMQVRSSKELQQQLGFSSISHSQISRKLVTLPTEMLEQLFLRWIERVIKLTPATSNAKIPIRIVDATFIRLPATLSHWAYVTRERTGVKIHMRVLALPTGQTIPEKAIPTTGNVSDYETMNELVVDKNSIHIMDRGYIKFSQFDQWVRNGILFVNRINESNGIQRVVAERAVPANTNIIRDAIVQLGQNPKTAMKETLRLVEFLDEKGRKYRIATTCMEESAIEIANLYRQRWLIELHFKWIKQHLKVVKLYSYHPQGIWNQIFVGLITYAMTLHIQLTSGTKLSPRDVLRSLRTYWEKSWSSFEKELHPTPTRTSKGRQKTRQRNEGRASPFVRTEVGIMKPSRAKAIAQAAGKLK